MITLINDYVVSVDSTDYTLLIDLHKQDKNGKDQYKTVGYYSTLENAIQGCIRDINRSQLATDTYTLEEAIKVIKTNNDKLGDLLTKCLGGV